MTTKELIRQEIERRIKKLHCADFVDEMLEGPSGNDGFLSFLDTLPDEPVNDCHDLTEAAREYATVCHKSKCYPPCDEAFKAGAEWGEKNAYKAIMKKADEVRDKRFDTDYEVKIEPAAGFDLGCVNVYCEGKLVGQYVEPKEEKKLPEGVEEAAEEYSRQVSRGHNYRDLTCGFIAGAEWQKAMMMEGAVEGRIHSSFGMVNINFLEGIVKTSFDKNGDKVKVIIVKEDK